jgi:hypothetical protein
VIGTAWFVTSSGAAETNNGKATPPTSDPSVAAVWKLLSSGRPVLQRGVRIAAQGLGQAFRHALTAMPTMEDRTAAEHFHALLDSRTFI